MGRKYKPTIAYARLPSQKSYRLRPVFEPNVRVNSDYVRSLPLGVNIKNWGADFNTTDSGVNSESKKYFGGEHARLLRLSELARLLVKNERIEDKEFVLVELRPYVEIVIFLFFNRN